MNLSIILESQFNYLNKKYGEQVGEANINAAINIDAKNAEKLLFGLANNVITEITPEAIPLVQDLDPFAKQTQKTEGHLKYEQTQKKAQDISRRYYQWILKVWKTAEAEVPIDREIFDYFEANEMDLEDIKDLTLDRARASSHEWHERIQNISANYGVHKHGIDTEGTVQIGQWFFVPLHRDDAELEGKLMQNCIRSYIFDTAGQSVMSMRNASNRPFVDIRIIDYNKISEIKGRQNRQPVPKYQKAVLDWLVTTDYKITGDDFLQILEENTKYVSRFVNRIDWNKEYFNRFSKFMTEDKADEILLKIIGDNMSEILEMDISNLRYATLRNIYTRLTGTGYQLKLYNKMISNYAAFESKGIGQSQWLELAGTDNACLASYRSVYDPESFLETILKLPISEFHLLYRRYVLALSNFNAVSGALTPYAEHICRAAADGSVGDAREGLFPQTILYCIPTKDLYELYSDMCFDETYNDSVFSNMAAKFIEFYYNIAENNSIIALKQNSIDMGKIIVPFLNSGHMIHGETYHSRALINILKILLSLDHEKLRYVYDNLPAVKSRLADNKTVRTARILIQTILNINSYDEITQIDIARETRDKETLLQLSQSTHQDTRQIATRRLRRIERLEALV